MKKMKMVQCATQVSKSSVSRKSIGGVEHIIVSSFTLPDNVVMNGGLYPAEEIANSFKSLERTLAPVEHPTDSDGNFLSASDPEAIHNFHAGAFNVNVTRQDGRVHIEKHINVQEALKTERGKRLLDRIDELETNENPRPIHTSVGLFLLVEELKEAQVNEAGDSFTWIARSMDFDHDAILLDSVAAATPDKGVGMAVNSDGEEVEVERIVIANNDDTDSCSFNVNYRFTAFDMERIEGIVNKLIGNAEGMSFGSVMEQLQQKINGIVTAEWIFLVDVFVNEAIFETPQGFFSVPWTMQDGLVEIAGIPIRVDKVVEYQPKVNSQRGENQMKEMILNALTEAGIETDGLGDDQLFAAYNELVAVKKEGEELPDVADAVANAMKPLVEQVGALAEQVNAGSAAEKAGFVSTVINSKKFPGLDEAAANALPLETIKGMAANCGTAHGVPFTNDLGGADDTFAAPAKMPK